MRNILLVLKHEFLTTIRKPSFWVTTFLLPGIIILLNVGTQVVTQDAFEESEPALIPGLDVGQAQHPAIIGYVDQAGLITNLPSSIQPGLLQPFATEEIANQALKAGVIEQYYVVPENFLDTSQIYQVSSEFTPFNVNSENIFNFVISYALTGDESEALVYTDPTFSVFPEKMAPQEVEEAGAESPLTFFVPFAVMFIFFFLITMSSGFMLQSVSREKENRTAEILLVSLRPRELMLGKVLGLSLIAILQLAFWFGGGLLALDRAREMLEMAANFALPDGFIVWGIGFFVLGFLLYASMMGAVGALAPNAREGGQFTFVILLPLLIPLWMNFAFIESPNGTLATVLSLFPLTAPVAMMTRMVATTVPLWQLFVSLGGLALVTYALVLVAARFFRADTLLSDTALNWRRMFAAFRSR